jgi:hypothetical protein
VGLKIVYNRDRPPYASIYEHDRAELVLVGRDAAINVKQYVGEGTQVESLEPANPITLGHGWYLAEIKIVSGRRPTRSYFFVDDKGDVAEFSNEGLLLAAAQTYSRGGLNWSRGGKWLHAEGPEPGRRRVMREALTRFDRIDKEIVPEPKGSKQEPVLAVGGFDPLDEYEALLNDAMSEKEMKEAKEAKRPPDPLGNLVDNFLKDL